MTFENLENYNIPKYNQQIDMLADLVITQKMLDDEISRMRESGEIKARFGVKEILKEVAIQFELSNPSENLDSEEIKVNDMTPVIEKLQYYQDRYGDKGYSFSIAIIDSELYIEVSDIVSVEYSDEDLIKAAVNNIREREKNRMIQENLRMLLAQSSELFGNKDHLL